MCICVPLTYTPSHTPHIHSLPYPLHTLPLLLKSIELLYHSSPSKTHNVSVFCLKSSVLFSFLFHSLNPSQTLVFSHIQFDTPSLQGGHLFMKGTPYTLYTQFTLYTLYTQYTLNILYTLYTLYIIGNQELVIRSQYRNRYRAEDI